MILRSDGLASLVAATMLSHEYLASQATLCDLREGDRLEVKVRAPRTC